MKIADLAKERAHRERPDAEHIRKDDFGREMFRFMVDYRADDKQWTFDLWAYDMADAQARVDGMNRDGVTLMGQIYSTIPA